MPFIDIRTTRSVSAETSESLKSRIGGIIDIIPEKSEAVLMVDINDRCNLFFSGKRQECCYMAVNLHHEAPMENKRKLIEKLFVIANNKTFLSPLVNSHIGEQTATIYRRRRYKSNLSADKQRR